MIQFYALLRFVLGQIFILAAFNKILDPASFADVVTNYAILPGFLVAPVAVLLPWLEFVCGVALVANRLTRGAALVIFLLLTTFLSGLGYNLFRGLDISCGCFVTDPNAEPHTLLSMLRDGLFWIMSLVVMAGAASDKRYSD